MMDLTFILEDPCREWQMARWMFLFHHTNTDNDNITIHLHTCGVKQAWCFDNKFVYFILGVFQELLSNKLIWIGVSLISCQEGTYGFLVVNDGFQPSMRRRSSSMLQENEEHTHALRTMKIVDCMESNVVESLSSIGCKMSCSVCGGLECSSDLSTVAFADRIRLWIFTSYDGSFNSFSAYGK